MRRAEPVRPQAPPPAWRGDFAVGAVHLHEREGKWDVLFAQFLPREEWLPWLNWPEVAPGLIRLSLVDPALRRRLNLLVIL